MIRVINQMGAWAQLELGNVNPSTSLDPQSRKNYDIPSP